MFEIAAGFGLVLLIAYLTSLCITDWVNNFYDFVIIILKAIRQGVPDKFEHPFSISGNIINKLSLYPIIRGIILKDI